LIIFKAVPPKKKSQSFEETLQSPLIFTRHRRQKRSGRGAGSLVSEAPELLSRWPEQWARTLNVHGSASFAWARGEWKVIKSSLWYFMHTA